MIRRPPRSTLSSSSAASDVYKRQKKIRLSLPLYSSEQRIRKSPLDPYVHERAWAQRRLPRNVHDAVAAGAAGADEPLSVETLDEHLERAPLHLAVQLSLDLLLNHHEASEAKARLSRRDVLLPSERGCLRARRIRERKDSGEPHLFEQRERCGEVVVRLARKAHDDVGREREVRNGAVKRPHEVEILGARVLALHSAQHRVGARLDRQV